MRRGTSDALGGREGCAPTPRLDASSHVAVAGSTPLVYSHTLQKEQWCACEYRDCGHEGKITTQTEMLACLRLTAQADDPYRQQHGKSIAAHDRDGCAHPSSTSPSSECDVGVNGGGVNRPTQLGQPVAVSLSVSARRARQPQGDARCAQHFQCVL
jgi:hypothetical protein